MEHASRPVILYDGHCNLCSRALTFALAHGAKGRFEFRPLARESPDSVVLLDGGRRYERSAAILRIAGELDAPWRWLAVLKSVPAPLLDAVYTLVANSRYRLFGRRDSCRLP